MKANSLGLARRARRAAHAVASGKTVLVAQNQLPASIVHPGRATDAVRSRQSAGMGIAYLVIPDVFGPGTREAVRNFQPSFLVAAMVFVLKGR